jgi:hypothetical protein
VDDEISDGDLVRLAGADDPVAFRLLVERYRPAALARALRLCGDLDDVEDIVQDALLQAFVALDRLQDPERFAAWLGGIVLNVYRASPPAGSAGSGGRVARRSPPCLSRRPAGSGGR